MKELKVYAYVYAFPPPKKSYLNGFTLYICVLNTALYSLMKTEKAEVVRVNVDPLTTFKTTK